MSLAKAREEAAKLRARISAGEDVIAERKQVLTPKPVSYTHLRAHET